MYYCLIQRSPLDLSFLPTTPLLTNNRQPKMFSQPNYISEKTTKSFRISSITPLETAIFFNNNNINSCIDHSRWFLTVNYSVQLLWNINTTIAVIKLEKRSKLNNNINSRSFPPILDDANVKRLTFQTWIFHTTRIIAMINICYYPAPSGKNKIAATVS